jgi:hypothetical protein
MRQGKSAGGTISGAGNVAAKDEGRDKGAIRVQHSWPSTREPREEERKGKWP